MAFSIYSLCNLGLTESQLVSIQSGSLTDLGSGKVVTSVNAPGLSSAFQVFANPVEIFRAATMALSVQFPDKYQPPIVNQASGYIR